MSTAAVAEALSISQETVRRLAAAGALTRVRIGPGRRLVRYRAADVEALVADGLRAGEEVTD
jgi:excisionase family DNA binding protein